MSGSKLLEPFAALGRGYKIAGPGEEGADFTFKRKEGQC
jgi:hypothetical protein